MIGPLIAAPDSTSRPIGRPGEPIVALSFPGGLFDTILQLGVIHALLVSGRRPPDVVAGISVGAINAAALAEIMQAGVSDPSKAMEKESRWQQTARFREFLNAYRSAPATFRRTFLPDPYEVDAQAPLKPLELPIHAKAAREAREGAVASSSGLIRFANDLLALRYSVAAFTRLVRRLLGLRATTNMLLVQRVRYRTVIAAQMLVAGLMEIPILAPLAGQLVLAIWRPESTAEGKTAAALISRPRQALRRVSRFARAMLGALALATMWVLLSALWVGHALMWILLELGNSLGLVPTGDQRATVVRVKLAQRKHQRQQEDGPRSHKRPLSRRIGKVGWKTLHRLLARYDLARSLGQTDAVREVLIDLFDRDYDGILDLTSVIAKALRDDTSATKRDGATRKSFGDYAAGPCPISVAAVATDLANGATRAVPDDTSVVDGLLAATAAPPLFPPIDICHSAAKGEPRQTTFIDASSVANEPIAALVEYLRDRANEASTAVHIYSVRPFPESGELPATAATGLVDVVKRVADLRRTHQASMESDLTELYSRLIPSNQVGTEATVAGTTSDSGKRRLLRASVFPITTPRRTTVNWQLFASSPRENDAILCATVAAGCRATLEALADSSIGLTGSSEPTVRCSDVQKTWAAREGRRWKPLTGDEPAVEDGPGVAEVCAQCALESANGTSVPVTLRGHLMKRPHAQNKDRVQAAWPSVDGIHTTHEPARIKFPPPVDAPPPDEAPWVSLLFSGGVFRGVFQVGVLNAVNEAGIEPRLLAGSSVGSIMAAMARALFACDAKDRPLWMMKVAATFLSLDRLVLTDRFADLVRRLTIRASETNWSLRDLDEVLRRYDAPSGPAFFDDLKKVTAGIERLFYVSPFELNAFVRAIRDGDMQNSSKLLARFVQDYLDRNGTSMEVLGAEPLALLVSELVLKMPVPNKRGQPANGHSRAESVPFSYPDDALYLLVTATNWTTGKLEMIGDQAAIGQPRGAMLLNALLASSAFPGVFRPRRSSEVFPLRFSDHQYVDGGVLDNLPLDKVAEFMEQASQHGLVARRPARGPHLLLTASLEPRYRTLSGEQLERVKSSWILLMNRVKQLSYNRKVDAFKSAQRAFRALYKQGGGNGWVPVDLEVAAIKPMWLCNTFGFHPMLGFRRARQADSIAHGCASTFVKLHALGHAEDPLWSPAPWSDKLDTDQAAANVRDPGNDELIPTPQPRNPATGRCWFRTDSLCPFSPAALRRDGLFTESSEQPIRDELATIYLRCGDPSVHARRASSEQSLQLGANGRG